MRNHPSWLLLLCAVVIGCSNTNHDLSTMNHELDVKSNPHPVQRYELTVTVDAPGPWDKVSGLVSYDITNEKCIRYNDFEGVYMRPASVSREFALTKVDDRTYRGYFYRDALVGGDYYGKGVCRWDVSGVGPFLTVHGLTFAPGVAFDVHKENFGDTLDGSSSTLWLDTKEYFDRSLNNANYGTGTMSDMERTQGEWFSVTTTVKEVKP